MRLPRPLAWILLSLPWLAAVAAFGWLVLLRFPPSGIVHVAFPLDGASPWFDPFLPAQRVTQPGTQPDGWIGQRIVDQPVYASARVPGPYQRVSLALETRPISQPLIELGILRDAESFSFDMHPVWSEVLSHGWHPAAMGAVRGFVRDGLPDASLLSTDADRLLVWDASTTAPERMDPAGVEQDYDVSLRGAHDFYVIPAAGEIQFQFAIQDMNRARGGSVAAFRLSKDDETLWTDAIGTSGSHDARPNPVYRETVALHGLKPGVYRLSLQADDDIFIRHIRTGAVHWVIGPGIAFGDTVGYSTSTQPAVVWTNSRHLSLQTLHVEGLQTVTLGHARATLQKTHHPYALDRMPSELSGSSLFTAPKGDIQVVGDGYFSFSTSSLFLPKPRRLTEASNPVAEGVDAVLTDYQPPETLSDGWLRLRTSFDLTKPEDRIKVSLSAPGLLVRQAAVDIRAVDLTYQRPALSWEEWWKEIKLELAAAWHRL